MSQSSDFMYQSLPPSIEINTNSAMNVNPGMNVNPAMNVINVIDVDNLNPYSFYPAMNVNNDMNPMNVNNVMNPMNLIMLLQ